MNLTEALEKLLPSFKEYYDVSTENVPEPFKAEAKFVSHMEQYFLVRSAKLSDIDSTETIYFATEQNLTLDTLKELSSIAWENGLKSVTPYYGHRNSDVSVMVLCENPTEEAMNLCKKIRFSKSYKFMLYGWSNFKLIVVDIKTGKIACNRFGSDYKKFFKKYVEKHCL